MYARWLCLVILFAVSFQVAACINTYDEVLFDTLQKPSKAEMDSRVSHFEKAVASKPSVENLNDFAVALILAGDYAKAITILHSVEARYPGQYRTAANLGTAYELTGNNTEALRWIKEGVRRNPQDHQGTEWLHVKIIEAKIQRSMDKAWLLKHYVSGLDFGDGYEPKGTPESSTRDFLGKVHPMAEVRAAIEYQLQERLKFVSPPDPFIADLYITLGDIDSIHHEGGYGSDEYYEAAKLFGPDKSGIVERRLMSFSERVLEKGRENYHIWLMALAAVTGIFGLLLFGRKSRKCLYEPGK